MMLSTVTDAFRYYAHNRVNLSSKSLTFGQGSLSFRPNELKKFKCKMQYIIFELKKTSE